MEPEGLLLCSQEPAIVLYPEFLLLFPNVC
jgi:hypothetical protein